MLAAKTKIILICYNLLSSKSLQFMNKTNKYDPQEDNHTVCPWNVTSL